jgi:hypothetical protein
MSGRSRRVQLVSAAVAVGGALLFFALVRSAPTMSSSDDVVDSPSIGPAAVLADERAAAVESGVVDPAPTPAVSDARVPTHQRIEMLAAAADRGDDWAACELAAELNRCRHVIDGRMRLQEQDLQRFLQTDAAELAADRRTAILDALQTFRQRQDECLQVPTVRLQSLQDRLFQVAMAGNTRAMAEFVIGESTSMAQLMADPIRYERYRTHAPVFFDQAFAAGEPLASMAILQLNVDISNIYRGVLPRQWRDPELVAAFSRRVRADIEPALLASGAPSAVAIARADALYDRYFAESPAMAEYIASARQKMRATRGEQSIEWTSMQLNRLDNRHCEELAH